MVSYTVERIIESAALHPDRIAYKVNDEAITYTQLVSVADRVADLLRRQGTSPVVIMGHKSADVVTAMLACLFAGRAYVPVEDTMPAERVEKIIESVGAEIVVSEKKYSFKDCYSLKELSEFAGLPVKEQDNKFAYIIFTSGSTGEPKGVPISYDNLDNFSRWISGLYPLNGYENAAVLNHASFSFDLSVADLYYSMCNSYTLVALTNEDKYDIGKSIEIIKNEKISAAVMTPTSAKLYLLDSGFNSENIPCLRCIYFCGEVLEARTAEKLLFAFPGLKIINAYGPTEATSAVSATLIDSKTVENNIALPVGDADYFATEIEIIDDEIILKGKSVFGGYIGFESNRCFISDGMNCYRTGDRGYIKDGRLYCSGRKDRQVKYMGYRMELDDIESNINRIDGVENSAVVAKFNSDSVVKKITAYVTVNDSDIDEAYIKNRLREKIPQYMIPKTIKIVEELPVNQNGKTDRKALSLL